MLSCASKPCNTNHLFGAYPMKGKHPDSSQLSLIHQRLEDLLNPTHPLYGLAEKMPWDVFDHAFADRYAAAGRPAKSIRLMVSLLILKQLYNLSDESVVERWIENPYFLVLYWRNFFSVGISLSSHGSCLFLKADR